MNETVLILAAALALVYATFSRLASESVLTPTMLFMVAGLAVGPLGLDVIDVEPDHEAVTLLATIALSIILCSDASQVDRHEIRKAEALPIRLLLIGLPLTMVAGAGVAILTFPGIEWTALVLLAVLLSPTDAALGQAVINSKSVPQRIREAINVESGLNDGIALPPIFVLLFLLGADLGERGSDGWVWFTAMQLLLAPIAGTILGLGGGRMIDAACRRGWVDPGIGRLTLPAIAMLAYALAEAIGGNGFIAAFVSGFTLGASTPAVREQMTEFGEAEGTVLSLLVFLLFGLTMVPTVVEHWTPATTVYALLSLTVVRMVPVAVSVLGMSLDWRTVLFVGWFGPRGIASILYMLLVVEYLGAPGYETILATGVQTVVLSVVLHGLTAAPLAKRYGAWMQQRGRGGARASGA